MKFSEKKDACKKAFYELAEQLKDTHVIVGSCNVDESVYLVPIGTEHEITYTSKPENSYRYSDHWNWFANVRKCPDLHYIQCYNCDMPRAKLRIDAGKASKPVFGICIGYFKDGVYRTYYGEKFDRYKKKWSWLD